MTCGANGSERPNEYNQKRDDDRSNKRHEANGHQDHLDELVRTSDGSSTGKGEIHNVNNRDTVKIEQNHVKYTRKIDEYHQKSDNDRVYQRSPRSP